MLQVPRKNGGYVCTNIFFLILAIFCIQLQENVFFYIFIYFFYFFNFFSFFIYNVVKNVIFDIFDITYFLAKKSKKRPFVSY